MYCCRRSCLPRLRIIPSSTSCRCRRYRCSWRGRLWRTAFCLGRTGMAMHLVDLDIVPDLLRWAARQYGRTPALAQASARGSVLTFTELAQHVAAGADLLHALAPSRGEPVLL